MIDKKLLKEIKEPGHILMRINHRYPLFKWMTDEMCLRVWYRITLGKKLDLQDPKTFNEKLQWLKLYNRKPEYTAMVDKYKVKKYVAERIGEKYVIPTFGVWNSFDEIDFNMLPKQFVLKCTHDSGGLIVCKDKNRLNIEAARKKITRSLKKNFFWVGREWPYKNVTPRIIAEQYIAENPKDYKLFCFNGVPKMTLVCSDRFELDGLQEDFFDENWNHLKIKRRLHGNSKFVINPPKNFEQMKQLAAVLSKDIPFSRIDFYEIENKIYFGEITFFPASGFEKFVPQEADKLLGDWIIL